MVTFKAVVIPGNKRADGTYQVKIRVYYNAQQRRLPTTIYARTSDLTRTLKIKNPTILNKTDELIGRMREIVGEISPFDMANANVDWIVARIREAMAGESFTLDFFEWCDRYMLTKGEVTRYAYAAALNSMERFLGRRTLDINDISRTMLLDYVEFVDGENKLHYDQGKKCLVDTGIPKENKGNSSRHLMKLQHMFNAAKDRYNDEDAGKILIPKSPFDKIPKYFPPPQGQKSIGQEAMQRIISAQVDNATLRFALDAFVVSFALMGANMADLYFAVPFVGEWRYNRQKTRTRRADRAEMRVTIPDELQPFISRLQDAPEPLRRSWWLPGLHVMAKTKNYATAKVNEALGAWCRQNGVPEFTFYAARHTWATLARKAGVEKATIDECLCHIGDYEMADIYAERDWELMTAANRKVLELFVW